MSLGRIQANLQATSAKNLSPKFEFHISKKARDTYQFDESFFSIKGTVIAENFQTTLKLAESINTYRKAQALPETALVRTAELHAMGLLHEVLHFVIGLYKEDVNPKAMENCEKAILSTLGDESGERLFRRFASDFPSLQVYRGELTANDYLSHSSEGVPNRELNLEEMLLLWVENQNPAYRMIRDLIDDNELLLETEYSKSIKTADAFFDQQPPFGPDSQPLLKMLLAPALASPDNIMGQLQFVLQKWEQLIARTPLQKKLLLSTDYIREEGKYFWMISAAADDKAKMPEEIRGVEFWGWGEKPTPQVADYADPLYGSAPERYTKDENWMPRLVLIAKSTYVWLDQLSKQYGRPIIRLDQIPDEELERLSRYGFTGLWFIGIWERSYASKKIKNINGNPEAVASAYSLDSYEIAEELGGVSAYENLKTRAAKFGVRLASDMVPNHMGLDSSWVINHPEWFLSTDYPPFPNYTFNGTDLSKDPRIGIFLEDGYWRKTDASVVFARLDRWTGDVKFIYHGNDGTGLPWNDTAQLNFLKEEVREVVIQTILKVAKMFPVIRFDAAMVLAKIHVERLWFPEPGKGGAIPSRSAFAMTKEEFDRLMPEEFWREVVDRVQKEAPDTLLLAEAFWMLEGYFVRTLGMHRVYNSAFMHMFKKEENKEYRYLIKNTLEFDPRILQRYVNFMNNPDEETAVNQFGKDDKYFGVCVMMATLPGLPMFGHGQIEGFSEKYGMEYKKAYYNEIPDEHLIRRHEREIFPLLKKRYLFANVDNYHLYDFYDEGIVNENVFAFSNRYGEERALVFFNNKYDSTSGWIKTSAGFLHGGKVIQRELGEGLGLSHNNNQFAVFRDQVSGLEYIRSIKELWAKGMFVELGGFKSHVFLDWREVVPSKLRPYDELEHLLGGRGVPSIEEAVLEISLRPVHESVQEILSPKLLMKVIQNATSFKSDKETVLTLNTHFEKLAKAIAEVSHAPLQSKEAGMLLEKKLITLSEILKAENGGDFTALVNTFFPKENKSGEGWRVFYAALVMHEVSLLHKGERKNLAREWHLIKLSRRFFSECGADEGRANYEAALAAVFSEMLLTAPVSLYDSILTALSTNELKALIGSNLHNGIVWFNKEAAEYHLKWIMVMAALQLGRSLSILELKQVESLIAQSEFQLARFIQLLTELNLKEAKSVNEKVSVAQVETKKPKPIQVITADVKPEKKAVSKKGKTVKSLKVSQASQSKAATPAKKKTEQKPFAKKVSTVPKKSSSKSSSVKSKKTVVQESPKPVAKKKVMSLKVNQATKSKSKSKLTTSKTKSTSNSQPVKKVAMAKAKTKSDVKGSAKSVSKKAVSVKKVSTKTSQKKKSSSKAK
ncbi:MAG: alpha-amylase family glycosyl hydrolase [Chloroherpetonaceae bacterium]|nr:alpha-amylase family glycosyl hydrolase [Chloroherpetonaceae bacterium]